MDGLFWSKAEQGIDFECVGLRWDIWRLAFERDLSYSGRSRPEHDWGRAEIGLDHDW